MRDEVYSYLTAKVGMGIVRLVNGKEVVSTPTIATQSTPIQTPEEIVRNHFSPSYIDILLNRGLDYVCRKSECLYAEVTGTVPINTRWFWLWNKALSIIKVRWEGVIITPTTIEEANTKDANWLTTTSYRTPTEYVYYSKQLGAGGGHSIRLINPPSVAGTLKLECTRLPDTMTSTVNCALEDSWHGMVIDWVCYAILGEVAKIQKMGQELEDMKREAWSRDFDRQGRVVNIDHANYWK
jgi:hypothetical protein